MMRFVFETRRNGNVYQTAIALGSGLAQVGDLFRSGYYAPAKWRDTMKWIIIAALALFAGEAAAQDVSRRIVGTWDFVVAEVTAPDGKKSFPFGETPKGVLIFTADGRFAQIHVASDVPKFASGNRLTGSADEYAAINRRSLALFGSYTIDDAKKTVTFKIVSSTFPNWDGEAQTRTIDKLDADEFVNTNPNVAGGRGSASNHYRRVK